MRSDRNAEMAILAASVASNTARAEARRHITGEDFDEPAHQAIWDAMARLDRHGKPVDAVTLMAVLKTDRRATELMPEVVTAMAIPDAIADHAAIVRGWAIKRRIEHTAQRVLQQAMNPETPAVGFAATVATQFATIRDSGLTEDVASRTLAEVLAEPDDEPDWLIPDVLERRDRLIVTGDEGLGKSVLLRQIAILAAAGMDPWDTSKRFKPIKATIIDCENTEQQVKRKTRPLVEFGARYGRNPAEWVNLVCSSRMDITRDKDLADIHRELDANQPDLVVIGPLYRLVPRALQTDDDAAPVLAALDTIRDRGICLLIEAHSGHALGKGGTRDMRPRGSSALLGWPEFGYGMRDIGTVGFCDFVGWRGQRDERLWPKRLRRADGFRWIPHEDETTWRAS